MKRPYIVGQTTALPQLTRVEPAELGPDRVRDATLLLIDARDCKQAWNALRTIRAHAAPAVYLKPVVLFGASGRDNDPLRKVADEYLVEETPSPTTIDRLTDSFHSIRRWTESLTDNERALDTDVSFKVLRYLASRGGELEPMATTSSPFGYVYPPVEAFLVRRQTEDSALQVLEFLDTQHLVSSRFVTKSHFCSSCGSAFLNFKEVCPDCTTEDIEAEELLHHFRCGHVGERSDFKTATGLACPKCERELRHIGVDYDKPSVVYRCNACNHRFQAPAVVSTCFHCGRSAEPEQQVLRPVKAYSVSAIGDNAARYGMEHLFMRVLDTELELWPYEALKQFARIERARIARYQLSSSSLAVVHFGNLSDLYVKVGKRAGEVFGELSQVFKSVLRKSDVIACHSESIFVLVLTETQADQAQRALERLEQGITELLESNVHYRPALHARAYAIDADLDVDAVVEAVVAGHDL